MKMRTPSNELSDFDQDALTWIARMGIVETPQLCRLTGRSRRALNFTMQRLREKGVIEIIERGQEDPFIFRLSKKGAKLMGLSAPRSWDVPAPMMLPHKLGVIETVCWFVESARTHALPRPRIRIESPRWRKLIPDAHIVVRLPDKDLSVFVEVDRGTERSTAASAHWMNKCLNYAELMLSGELEELTGYNVARILVVAPHQARVKWLYHFVNQHSPDPWRYWYTMDHAVLQHSFTEEIWFNDGQQKPLLTGSQVTHQTTRQSGK